MEIRYVFTRKRREFGAPCRFTDVGPHLIADIQPDPSLIEDYVQMPKLDRGTQCRQEYSLHEVNTITAQTESRGMDHIEGGWPADVDHRDDDQVARFKKKIEKDEGYIATVRNLGDLVEKLVMENNSVDIYQRYYADEEVTGEEDVKLKTLGVYRDVGSIASKLKRRVSSISWSPDGSKLAVAYLPEATSDASACSTESCIWDVDNSVEPYVTLKPEAPIFCLACSGPETNLLAGGYENGQIGLWDLSKGVDGGGPPSQLTPVTESHTAAVTGICWIHSKCGSEFFSASADGQVMSWDARNIEKSTQTINLNTSGNGIGGGAVTCLEYDSTCPYHFMVASDAGNVFLCSRRSDPTDCIIARFECFPGPVLSVERNHFMPKVFAATTAWKVQLWSEDNTTAPLLCLNSSNGYIVDARWCSTRPSVLFVSKSTGCLEMWDVLVKHEEAVLSFRMETIPLTCVRPRGGESLHLACGVSDGSLYVLEMPRSCGFVSKSEKTRVATMFERDSKRAALLEIASKERRLKELEAAKAEEEASRLKEKEISPAWAPVDVGEESFTEMASLEYGSGFLTEEEVEEHQQEQYKALGLEEETGEEKFLEILDREVQTEKTLKSALVKVVTDVESDTSLFPLPEIAIDEEYGEDKFLEELERHGASTDVLDRMMDKLSSGSGRDSRRKN